MTTRHPGINMHKKFKRKATVRRARIASLKTATKSSNININNNNEKNKNKLGGASGIL